MPNLQWKAERFYELTVDQLFELFQLRINVFVVEQQCAYPELDEHDRHAETRHLSGRDESRQLIARVPLGLHTGPPELGAIAQTGLRDRHHHLSPVRRPLDAYRRH